MCMEPSSARRHLWNALAGLGVGAACTVATAPFATGWTCSEADLAWALVLCSPILSIVPTLTTGSPRLGRAGSFAVTGVLAILMGAVNATVVWAITQLAVGRDLDELGTVMVFSLPFGGVPGLGFALPLALGGWFARDAGKASAASIGGARGLLLVVALVGAATSLVVVTMRDLVYTAWPFVVAFDVVVALLCVGYAARDALLALHIRRLVAGRSGTVVVAEDLGEEPPADVPHVLSGGSWRRRRVQLLRVAPQDPGPYRTSEARTPVLSLAGPVDFTLRALVRGIALLVLCAGLLGWSAAQAPHIAPRPPNVCER